ncbi:MAG: signal peptidase I [Euryarchaeota archaeon]|nr:signal peptidase I [Euryarchaeota archaeon]
MNWSRAGTAISLAVLALVLFMAVSPVIGFRFDPVRSGSMSPDIDSGDLVISNAVDDEDIRVGDVIIYRHAGVLICHRVIALDAESNWIQTQGDANEDPDPYTVSYDDVVSEIGLVVPYLGHAVLFLKSVYGWILIITIVAVMLLLGWYDDKHKNDARSGGEQ